MMPSRQRPGFSLLEAALSSVLVGVLLVAAMRTVAASAVSQRLASEQAVAQALAEGLLAEILPAAYREPDGSSAVAASTSGVNGRDGRPTNSPCSISKSPRPSIGRGAAEWAGHLCSE